MKWALGPLAALALLAAACGGGGAAPSIPNQRAPINGAAAAAPTSAPAAAPTTAAEFAPSTDSDANAEAESAAAVGAAADASDPAAPPTSAPAAAAPTSAPAESEPAAVEPMAQAGGASAGSEIPNPRPTEVASSTTATSGLNRMIIYTTSLTMLVTNMHAAIQELGDLAIHHGGFGAGVEQHLNDEQPSAIVKLRVPSDKHQEMMNRLRAHGVDVVDEKTDSSDVTEEYDDLQNQIRSLESTYERYLSLMERTQTVEEILTLQQRIDEVKLQIDRAKGRANFLGQLSALATITVTLRPAEDVLRQDYTAALGAQRTLQFEERRLKQSLERQISEDEMRTLAERLAQVQLQLEKADREVRDIVAKAESAKIALPQPDPTLLQDPPDLGLDAERLAERYLELNVAIRKKELRQQEVRHLIDEQPAPVNLADLQRELQASVLELRTLRTELRQVEEQATRDNLTLPELDPSLLEDLVMEGSPELTRPEPQSFWGVVVETWDASIGMLYGVALVLTRVTVFFWWLLPLAILAAFVAHRGGLFRRPAPRPVPPTPPTPMV